MKGRIFANSVPGQGSTFSVFLPLHQGILSKNPNEASVENWYIYDESGNLSFLKNKEDDPIRSFRHFSNLEDLFTKATTKASMNTWIALCLQDDISSTLDRIEEMYRRSSYGLPRLVLFTNDSPYLHFLRLKPLGCKFIAPPDSAPEVFSNTAFLHQVPQKECWTLADLRRQRAPQHLDAPLKALFLDDEITDLRIFERMCQQFDNIEFIGTSNPNEILDLAKREKPDVVVLDMHLGSTNGIEVASKLRKASDVPCLPLILASADTQLRIYDSARQNHLTEVLHKPILKSVLLDHLLRFHPKGLEL